MDLLDYVSDPTVVFFVANSLYVISYMLTSMFWLRLLAIIAAASTFPYFYYQTEPLWSALFWQACFLTVNLVNFLLLLYNMRGANFDEHEDLAYEVKFSDLKPHEVRPIFRYAQRLELPSDEVLLEDGESNETLYLILRGECKVLKFHHDVAVLGPGHFIGEMSFLSRDPVSADVITASDVKLMSWRKSDLQPLFKKHGLYESYFYSLCSVDVAEKLRHMTEVTAAP